MNDSHAELLALGGRLRSEPGAMLALAEQFLKVRDRTGSLVPLAANAAQRQFEARAGRANIVLKARQMGMTTWIAGRLLLKTITAPGTLTVQVAHTREAAEGIFTAVQRMYGALPEEWRKGALKRTRSTSGRIVFGEIDSEFRVLSAGAENAGRGWTVQHLHLSEVARWPGDARAMLAGLRAALAPGGELTMESTPAGAHGAFYEEWQRAEETGLVRHFFPWWLEPAYVAAAAAEMTAEEQELCRVHALTAEQIGYRRGLMGSFRTLRAQEYAEDAVSCFKASGDCCFEAEAIDARLAELASGIGPYRSKRGGALLYWLPVVRDASYLVGVDTAGGGAAGDFAAMQVIERETGLQCAELRQRLSPLEQARVAAALAREYNQALVCVERNNMGGAVLSYLEQTERYPHVYGQRGVAGWLTSTASKPAMVSRLGALLVESPALFFSPRLLGECRTFVTRANGSTGAANGAHDDLLMAMAIAHAVRAQA